MNILVTGGAGFIGSAVAKRLVAAGHVVTSLDNFNHYYDPTLKRDRVQALTPQVPVREIDLTDRAALTALFSEVQFDVVCHLAAQAGVRYSVEAPEVYVHANVLGTQTLFEVMRAHGVPRMVFASTSSVYGTTTEPPYQETAAADRPVSIYAATKRSGELIAHNYFAQYGIETTCLRFFTVYGPWSRPDMAMLKFARLLRAGKPIELYNDGKLRRDFTYVDDIVSGFAAAVERPLGYEIVNLGSGRPVELRDFVTELEQALGVTAQTELLPMQPGDVYETFADITKAQALLDYAPSTSFSDGVHAFADWFREYYR